MLKIKSLGIMFILVSLLIMTGCENVNLEETTTVPENQVTSINIIDEETEEGIDDARVIIQGLEVDSYTDRSGQTNIEYSANEKDMYLIEVFAKDYGYYPLEDFQAGSTDYTLSQKKLEEVSGSDNIMEVAIVGEKTESPKVDEEGNVIFNFDKGEGYFSLQKYLMDKYELGEIPYGYYEITVKVDGYKASQFYEFVQIYN